MTKSDGVSLRPLRIWLYLIIIKDLSEWSKMQSVGAYYPGKIL